MSAVTKKLCGTARLVAVIIAYSATAVIGQETTAQGPICVSTGPSCIHLANCSNLDGSFQWCGGCGAYVQCTGNQGTLYDWYNPAFQMWDDNRKSFQTTSTTCHGCYFQCPPGPSAPPGDGGVCDKTGPTCVDAPQFCNGLVSSRRIQYCASCKTYVNCIPSGSGFVNCPDGTFFDQTASDCLPTSTTCVECYAPCNETITTSTTTTTATTDVNNSVATDSQGNSQDPLETSTEALDRSGEPGDSTEASESGNGSVVFTVSAKVAALSSIAALCAVKMYRF